MKRKKILFVVLNWGLGHATRSSVLVEALLNQGYSVHLASDGEAGEVLKKGFPNLPYHELKGYGIRYKKGIWNTVSLVLNLPKYWRIHRLECKAIAQLQQEHSFDGLITDNRPSGFVKGIPNAYISHQLKVKAGIFTPLVTLAHSRICKKYSEVWVPDTSDQTLSGALGRSAALSNVRYIGWLSRLKKVEPNNSIPWLAVISGPEPSRSLWEEELIQARESLPEGGLIVRGKPTEKTDIQGVVDYMDQDLLSQAMANTQVVISRTGYSTLMDLACLHKKAILVPTPGQTEQEYLANHLEHNSMGWVIARQGRANYAALIQKIHPLRVSRTADAEGLPKDLFRLFQGE